MTPPQAMHSSSGWAWNETIVAITPTLPDTPDGQQVTRAWPRMRVAPAGRAFPARPGLGAWQFLRDHGASCLAEGGVNDLHHREIPDPAGRCRPLARDRRGVHPGNPRRAGLPVVRLVPEPGRPHGVCPGGGIPRR